jgi:hypothetical protein
MSIKNRQQSQFREVRGMNDVMCMGAWVHGCMEPSNHASMHPCNHAVMLLCKICVVGQSPDLHNLIKLWYDYI